MIRIGMGQIEIVPGNPSKNKTTILQAIQYAKALRLDVLVLPEMAISGYMIGDLWDQPAFVDECLRFGEEVIKASSDLAIIFGNVAVDRNSKNMDGRVRKFNAIYIAQHGQLVQPSHSTYPFIVKTLSPNYRFFNEARYFTDLRDIAFEENRSVQDMLSIVTLSNKDGKRYNIAPLLCEDSWDDNYSLSPTKLLYAKSLKTDMPINAFINISASPFTLGKNERRHRLFQDRAREMRIPIFYINAVGIQNNGKSICTFDGQSTYYSADGSIAEQLPAFEGAIKAVILPGKNDSYSVLRSSNTLVANAANSFGAKTTTAISESTRSEVEQVYKALHFGLTKFLEQTGIKKVVIGASGGIDSAVNAALYASVLPPSQVYLVNMPSRFNSTMTKDLARDLATNLGCPYAICPVQDSLELTTEQLSALEFVSPHGSETLNISSFVKENIQARDRSSRILAGIAAGLGGAFTCNGNKTELSIGYATLYGDMAGFLAATGDLWKFQMYELAHYLNEVVYKREVIPQGTISVIPSAELSDSQDITKGQGDPLQYEYHDRLFRSFIEPWNRLTPEDVLSAYIENRLEDVLQLSNPISTYFKSSEAFVADLERWWNMQSGMAVAKRIQSPPIIVISRRSYGGDLQESQMKPYYTQKYLELKESLK
ncbi:MAG: NAD(+) synthase [Veillonella sp.]|uniref:NAD(+) synthase n=1 Tax=Veillonella sp. TaxID=1926307 RepID=UPI0025FE030F|nr:NAD(+) synthase [Veillonella sp.]MBS4912887.1 NAD(+) synthase [Veillonella sp.]